MNVALVGAADFNKEHFLCMDFQEVVAVDRGWKSCTEAGITADVALGDFDSLGYVPEGVLTYTFPTRKDESDMELAFRYAQEHGATSVYMYGGLSGRIDHTIANLQLIGDFCAQGMKIVGVGDSFAVLCLCGKAASPHSPRQLAFTPFDPASLKGSYAPYISLFAFGGTAKGVDIEGLEYEVCGFDLPSGSSRGLSNQFRGTPAAIKVSDGTLVIIVPLEALMYASY